MFLDIASILSDDEISRLEELLERIPEEVNCRSRKNLLVYYIRSAIESNEVQPIIIYGMKGAGKSTLALKSVAYYFMKHNNMECGEAYFEALNRLIHTPKEFFTAIEKYNDILIWDDAGVWLSTYFWYLPEMRPYLVYFFNWYDTSRTDVNVLVFTTPHIKKLPPVLREDVGVLRVRVKHVGNKVLPDGRRIKKALAHIVKYDISDYTLKPYTEELGNMGYDVYLPDLVFEAYSIIRDGYHRLAKKLLKKVLIEKKMLKEEIAQE